MAHVIRLDPSQEVPQWNKVSLRTRLKIKEHHDITDWFQLSDELSVQKCLAYIRALEEIVRQSIPATVICDPEHVDVRRDTGTLVMNKVMSDMLPLDAYDVIVVNPHEVLKKEPFEFRGSCCMLWTLNGAKKALKFAYPIEQCTDAFVNLMSRLGILNVTYVHVPEIRRKRFMHRKCQDSSWLAVLLLVLIGVLVYFSVSLN